LLLSTRISGEPVGIPGEEFSGRVLEGGCLIRTGRLEDDSCRTSGNEKARQVHPLGCRKVWSFESAWFNGRFWRIADVRPDDEVRKVPIASF
jgi:hypothetical protein